jgi:acetyl esterase/lipase
VKTTLKILMLTTLLYSSANAEAGSKKRYLDPVFTEVNTDSSIIYSEAVNCYGRLQKLAMDVYEPKGDALAKRPAILFLHGGAFMRGSRKDDYAIEFCRQFAKRGYVTISLDYRLGVKDMYNPASYGDAIYRSVQDARAAVRYVKANAAKYGIDPDQVYLGGGSAGAIAALQAAYWTQKDVPQYLNTKEMGSLDATGHYSNYSSYVSGVINCWGAVIDTAYLHNARIPVVSIHGEDDPFVPYKHTSMGQFGLFGSYYITEKAKELNIPAVLKAFPNTGHGFKRSETEKWNTTINTISEFMYSLVEKNG